MSSSRILRLCFDKALRVNNWKTQNVISRGFLTSKKNRDATPTTTTAAEVDYSCKPKTEKKSKWQSFGFGTNEQEDKLHMHLTFFLGITMSIGFLSFFTAYAPSDIDWIQREAFLELRRREQNGLPLVDCNYIDPARINLPTDEELGDTEIIV